MATILYISYDGLCEPLGQSQVYQYLRELVSRYDHRFHLITFEKPHDLRNKELIQRLKLELSDGRIKWYPLLYHKRLTVIATAYDVLRGLAVALYLILRYKIKIVHVRSYVPAVIAVTLRTFLGKPFIFDMRGFWVDEKVDVGAWPRNGILHRIGKLFERWFLRKAKVIISLTDAAIFEMKTFSYLKDRPGDSFLKISTCVNLDLFKPLEGAKGAMVVGYVGGASTWYNFDLAVQYFLEFKRRRSDAKFLIINSGEHNHILSRLKHFGMKERDYQLLALRHQEMPGYISKMNIVVFFIRPFYSKMASAPTKLGEVLACGVPCLTTGGVGDMSQLLCEENVGVVVEDQSEKFIPTSVDRALNLLKDPGLRDRCVTAAEVHFSLNRALKQYDHIYSEELD